MVAVPPFEERHLLRGHAVHFRCRRLDVAGLRIDFMASLRGVAGFEELWERRTTIEVDGQPIDLLAMEDLVRAKKTQRDKDWPMIRRLLEQSYFARRGEQTPARVEFWLRELQTPELLLLVVADHPDLARAMTPARPAVQAALGGRADEVFQLLENEQQEQRRRDREYWEPLKRELEQLRQIRRRGANDL